MAATIQTIQTPKRARALDTSGNNNHGQIYSGRALEFDGVTDYLSVADNDSIDLGASDFTISAWIYTGTSLSNLNSTSIAGSKQNRHTNPFHVPLSRSVNLLCSPIKASR